MELIKKINNNFALAKDSTGKLVIVSGKGIGFEKMPCVLKDLTKISHTYYDVENRFVSHISSIPEDVMELTSEAVKYANHQLKKDLNPNLIFTLADHINFVLERTRKGIQFNYGLSYEIRYLHPEEMEVSSKIVNHINRTFNCKLNEDEISIIAMHLLEAENIVKNTRDSEYIKKTVDEISKIVMNDLDISLEKDGFNYYRFVSHIQYLLERKDKEKPLASANQQIYESIKNEFPIVYKCVLKIQDYFKEEHKWLVSNEELLYLMLHINRLCSKEDCNRKGITS